MAQIQTISKFYMNFENAKAGAIKLGSDPRRNVYVHKLNYGHGRKAGAEYRLMLESELQRDHENNIIFDNLCGVFYAFTSEFKELI
jgi:hypothetical protein